MTCNSMAFRRIRSPSAWVALLCAAMLAGAHAAVEKSAMATGDGIEMYWWPKLPELEGWRQDPVASQQYGANALLPEGKGMDGAEAMIYAKAQYKPRARNIESLGELIERDRRDLAEGGSKVRMLAGSRLVSADGRKYACMLSEPAASGIWEKFCYLEEGDYYLVFALRTRSRASFNASLPNFETLVSRYRE